MAVKRRRFARAKGHETPAKRVRTRAALVNAAFSVYALKGFDDPTIDDFIAAAGVSRGTFYNYFQTREDLLAAVAADLTTFITSRIGSAIRTVLDPLEVIAVAVRYFVAMGAENETRAWVLARMIPIAGDHLSPHMSERVRESMEAAAATGRIRPRSIPAAIDLGLGLLAMAIRHNLSQRAQPYPPELVATMALQSLGANPRDAEEVAYRPLPEVHGIDRDPMVDPAEG